MKTIINLFIAAIWLWVFSNLGWIQFAQERTEWQNLAIAAFVSWIVMTILSLIFVVAIFATCGIGCFVYPIFMLAQGYLVLLGVDKITHLFTMNPDNSTLTLIMMSIAYGLLRLPEASSSSSTTSSSS